VNIPSDFELLLSTKHRHLKKTQELLYETEELLYFSIYFLTLLLDSFKYNIGSSKLYFFERSRNFGHLYVLKYIFGH
jgi:hypothetical protein